MTVGLAAFDRWCVCLEFGATVLSSVLLWFRRDLRLADNPALEAAIYSGKPLICAYIHAPLEEAPWAPGAASLSWLHHSLAALDESLRERGQALRLFKGSSLAVLERLVHTSGVEQVFWNRVYEPALIARDQSIKAALRGRGIEVHSFNGTLLHEPWEIKTGSGTPYRVFTPYWRNCRERLRLAEPSSAPRVMPPAPEVASNVALDSLALLPKLAWDRGFYGPERQPGERGAQITLNAFTDDALARYKEGRDRPDLRLTSRLSSALRFGEISASAVSHRLLAHAEASGSSGLLAQVEGFVRELGWRDFSYHLLYHYPAITDANLNPQFDKFAWAWGPSDELVRWQRGRTGIPIVDAGMRELWQTGFMHNRVRMIVASLLTKNMGIHWLEGARWFWDTLTDADLASNTQGWQWSAGSGADAQPYFRIFNPVTQGEKFDPSGEYVRRYIPELARVPLKNLHSPWTAPRSTHPDYPEPLLELKSSRERALAAYQLMRAASPQAK